MVAGLCFVGFVRPASCTTLALYLAPRPLALVGTSLSPPPLSLSLFVLSFSLLDL